MTYTVSGGTLNPTHPLHGLRGDYLTKKYCDANFWVYIKKHNFCKASKFTVYRKVRLTWNIVLALW